MKPILGLLILIFFFTSCGELPVGKIYQKDFTNCYDSDTLVSNLKLKFDGYYQLKDINDKDSSDQNIIFYPDGTFVDNVIFPDYFPLWGIYRTKGDTVITQYMNITYGSPRIVWESWYKIVTPDKLKLIYATRLGDDDIQYRKDGAKETTIGLYRTGGCHAIKRIEQR
jgi:hypothetical protein